jgi:hypothetical protein
MGTASRTISLPVLSAFAPMSARRILILGGIALIAAGMVFGDVFAVFVLHQNANRQAEALLATTEAVAAGNPGAVKDIFDSLGGLLEDRGTKVDTHVHMSDAGYLALLLAWLQPWVRLSSNRKKWLAGLFIAGGVLLPLGIFLIHYVGLAYSPFSAIGWASVLADSAGALLIGVLIAEAWGISQYLRGEPADSEPALSREADPAGRLLLSGGTVLVLLGFLQGAWYAGADLYRQEHQETAILNAMISAGSAADRNVARNEVNDFSNLAAERGVKIAAHSHIIEFGLLAILLSFVQPCVFLSQRWKRRWVEVLLAGSMILPAFVLLELKLGLVAGGVADAGGLMVIVALLAMAVGVLRYSGSLDSHPGALR